MIRSGTIGSAGSAGKTVVWRSMATTAATASATNARTLTSGRGRRGRRRRLRGRLGGRDGSPRHQDFLETLDVDARRDVRRLEEPLPALVDGRHPPDRKPLREDPVEPGGHELVADLHVLRPLDVLERAAGVDGPLHDPARARALDERV